MSPQRADDRNQRWPVKAFRTTPDVAELLDRMAADAGVSTAQYLRTIVETKLAADAESERRRKGAA